MRRLATAVRQLAAVPQETQSVTHVVPAQLSQPQDRQESWLSGLLVSSSNDIITIVGTWWNRRGQHGMTAWRFLISVDYSRPA